MIIVDMPRKLPPFVYREKNRHGKWAIYFRRGKGKRTRLPDDPDSQEFQDRYTAALTVRPWVAGWPTL